MPVCCTFGASHFSPPSMRVGFVSLNWILMISHCLIHKNIMRLLLLLFPLSLCVNAGFEKTSENSGHKESWNILIHKCLLLNPRQSLGKRTVHLSEVLTIFIFVRQTRNLKVFFLLPSLHCYRFPKTYFLPESRNTENRTQKHINGIVKNIEINNSPRFLRQSLFSLKEINVSGFWGLESGESAM